MLDGSTQKDVAYITHPIANFKLVGTKKGLEQVQFCSEIKSHSSSPIPDSLLNPVQQLTDYLNKKRTSFSVNLNPVGTSFQQKVWNMLLEIPYGKTWTYKELAHKLGDHNVIRAAASANGKNPLPIFIPCHRVIGSNGTLVGYAGGLPLKKSLLELESPYKQQSLF